MINIFIFFDKVLFFYSIKIANKKSYLLDPQVKVALPQFSIEITENYKKRRVFP